MKICAAGQSWVAKNLQLGGEKEAYSRDYDSTTPYD